MLKNEQCQVRLKENGSEGVEKFGIPPGSPVEYYVTMIKCERVRKFVIIQMKNYQPKI
jgi:hypothetical protein